MSPKKTYTIGQAAQLSGVSERTLRYYDERGLLSVKRDALQNYRRYDSEDLKQLQTILFYRELGFELSEIESILHNPSFSRLKALMTQKKRLVEKKEALESLIKTIDATIAEQQGETDMKDTERFIGLKRSLIEENEKNFGREIRDRYSEETVEKANAQMMGMDEKTFTEMTMLGQLLLEKLALAAQQKDPCSEQAQEVARLHKEWLAYTWPSYSKESHANLVSMYVEDERFSSYYQGNAAFLRDAVHCYLKSH